MIIDGNKWIDFELQDDTGKAQWWLVMAKSPRAHLGDIEWYSDWRQYVFQPEPNTEYHNGCLDTISTFLTRLNKERRISPER